MQAIVTRTSQIHDQIFLRTGISKPNAKTDISKYVLEGGYHNAVVCYVNLHKSRHWISLETRNRPFDQFEPITFSHTRHDRHY